jgi:hypothetical protein
VIIMARKINGDVRIDIAGTEHTLTGNYERVWDFITNPAVYRGTRDDTHAAVSQAVAYVWGWMDAGGEMPTLADPALTVAFEFGWFYGSLRMTGHSYPSIAEAWRSWAALY